MRKHLPNERRQQQQLSLPNNTVKQLKKPLDAARNSDTDDAYNPKLKKDIRAPDKMMERNALLWFLPTPSIQKLMNNVIELQRWKFLARYGRLSRDLCNGSEERHKNTR
ncbi:uncharacterized protein Z518_07431 [Rhinocladiella mackenziei CBS 650.93]|uniref:Uncharacterized protein n=1 Tax=Rhinocladiella mackenziei CBS 650.93 TaxID=1442369 RepID=A0A0D2H0C8_9EURO|nr:uncharacterized protein Z518_07431 [Rhinocladiella mackenziei CBS 650.93]KIX03878.1 hypothetical protein Z518_07431 [Rhinocladiella mackenziei CBS 650.93]